MTEEFETGYQPIGSEPEDEDTRPGEHIIHVVPDKSRGNGGIH